MLKSYTSHVARGAMVVKEVFYTPRDARNKTDRKATIQEWKGVRFVRRHSFLITVEEIVQRSNVNDVVKVGIVGQMGSGKTTLARAIAHVFHVRAKQKYGTPFAVRVVSKKELLDLDRTLRDLAVGNYVLIFDDVSFLDASGSQKDLAKVKQTLTTIRHRERDVKFLLIYNYHYGRGLDKFLRQTDYTYYTSVGEEEDDVLAEKHRHSRTAERVAEFRRRVVSAMQRGRWTVPAGRDSKHTYVYRDPWIPVLFTASGGQLRHAIGPTREWLAPRCVVCSAGEQVVNEIAPGPFLAAAEQTLGKNNVRTALKQILLENGIDSYSRSIINARRAINEALNTKQVSLPALASHLGIQPWRPHRRASHDRFVAAIEAAAAAAPTADGKPGAAGGGGKS